MSINTVSSNCISVPATVSNTLVSSLGSSAINSFSSIKVNPDEMRIPVYSGQSLTDCIIDVSKRLDLLESNVKALPAIIAETIISAFRDIPTSQTAPVFTLNGGYTPLPNMTAGQSIYLPGNTGTTTGMGVDLSTALGTMVGMVVQQLSAKVNYDELNGLRARIRQLEEDLGYREAVAKKLMEP